MIISVASGKGGTGKTTVSTNLAMAVGSGVRFLDNNGVSEGRPSDDAERGLFLDFEDRFLRHDVQGALVRGLFNPINWFRYASPWFDRVDMAAEYYDKHIFKNATFSDLYERDGPFIEINATDLGTGDRFAWVLVFLVICKGGIIASSCT